MKAIDLRRLYPLPAADATELVADARGPGEIVRGRERGTGAANVLLAAFLADAELRLAFQDLPTPHLPS